MGRYRWQRQPCHRNHRHSATGINVVASGYSSAADGKTTTPSQAYFDKAPGIGVCANTPSGQCIPSNDDNVGSVGGRNANGTYVNPGSFETLVLTFNRLVNLTEVLFAAEGHGIYHGSVKVDIGDGTGFHALAVHASGKLLGLVGKIFSFQYIRPSSGSYKRVLRFVRDGGTYSSGSVAFRLWHSRFGHAGTAAAFGKNGACLDLFAVPLNRARTALWGRSFCCRATSPCPQRMVPSTRLKSSLLAGSWQVYCSSDCVRSLDLSIGFADRRYPCRGSCG